MSLENSLENSFENSFDLSFENSFEGNWWEDDNGCLNVLKVFVNNGVVYGEDWIFVVSGLFDERDVCCLFCLLPNWFKLFIWLDDVNGVFSLLLWLCCLLSRWYSSS